MAELVSTAILTALLSRALASPLSIFFTLCGLTIFITRTSTGYSKWKQQNQVASPEKAAPILPYWLPYFGHGPAAAWSFTGLLNGGRYVFDRVQSL